MKTTKTILKLNFSVLMKMLITRQMYLINKMD